MEGTGNQVPQRPDAEPGDVRITTVSLIKLEP